eukprot:4015365-Pyramimonas_sp.AAC.1
MQHVRMPATLGAKVSMFVMPGTLRGNKQRLGNCRLGAKTCTICMAALEPPPWRTPRARGGAQDVAKGVQRRPVPEFRADLR